MFLEAMLRELNASTELAQWTHRAPDDPGIALLESAALVADILTFYPGALRERGVLRTAQWRESVQELVRLTGYRLAPGIGGRASFAVEVKGASPVVVPAGFPIKGELESAADPVDFLTSATHTAYSHLSKFRLYRQQYSSAGINALATELEIFAVGGSEDPAILEAFDLKKGDKLMLVPSAPAWLTDGSTVTDSDARPNRQGEQGQPRAWPNRHRNRRTSRTVLVGLGHRLSRKPRIPSFRPQYASEDDLPIRHGRQYDDASNRCAYSTPRWQQVCHLRRQLVSPLPCAARRLFPDRSGIERAWREERRSALFRPKRIDHGQPVLSLYSTTQ